MTAPVPSVGCDAADVAAFLRANPGWLADHPELYRTLTPPRRVHGEALADHMAEMVRAERHHAAECAARADDILAAGRAAAGLTARVQDAVLALMRATDTADCLTGELPGLLGVDAVALCAEEHRPGTRPLPPGTVQRIMGGRDVVFRESPDDAPLLHAEAARLARHDALVRVPATRAPTLLALVARDRQVLEPGQGAGALAFLGRAVTAALARAA